MSLREKLLSYTPAAPIPVTFRGEALFVRELSATEYISVGKAEGAGALGFAPALLSKAIVDADGKRVFEDGDVAALAALPWKDLKQPFEAALRLNSASADPNRSSGQTSGPPTTSASTSAEETSSTPTISLPASQPGSSPGGSSTSATFLSPTTAPTSTPPSSVGTPDTPPAVTTS